MIPFAELPLTLPRGRAFEMTLQPSTAEVRYALVTAIATTAPVRLTAPAHGIPAGWPVSAVGPAGASPALRLGPQYVTVVDADTLEFNGVHALDWPPYEGEVHLAYNAPLSLTGYTPLLRVFLAATDALPLFELALGNGLEIVDHTLTARFSAAQTALLISPRAVYDLSISNADGNFLLARGNITVLDLGGV